MVHVDAWWKQCQENGIFFLSENIPDDGMTLCVSGWLRAPSACVQTRARSGYRWMVYHKSYGDRTCQRDDIFTISAHFPVQSQETLYRERIFYCTRLGKIWNIFLRNMRCPLFTALIEYVPDVNRFLLLLLLAFLCENSYNYWIYIIAYLKWCVLFRRIVTTNFIQNSMRNTYWNIHL